MGRASFPTPKAVPAKHSIPNLKRDEATGLSWSTGGGPGSGSTTQGGNTPAALVTKAASFLETHLLPGTTDFTAPRGQLPPSKADLPAHLSTRPVPAPSPRPSPPFLFNNSHFPLLHRATSCLPVCYCHGEAHPCRPSAQFQPQPSARFSPLKSRGGNRSRKQRQLLSGTSFRPRPAAHLGQRVLVGLASPAFCPSTSRLGPELHKGWAPFTERAAKNDQMYQGRQKRESRQGGDSLQQMGVQSPRTTSSRGPRREAHSTCTFLPRQDQEPRRAVHCFSSFAGTCSLI